MGGEGVSETTDAIMALLSAVSAPPYTATISVQVTRPSGKVVVCLRCGDASFDVGEPTLERSLAVLARLVYADVERDWLRINSARMRVAAALGDAELTTVIPHPVAEP